MRRLTSRGSREKGSMRMRRFSESERWDNCELDWVSVMHYILESMPRIRLWERTLTNNT